MNISSIPKGVYDIALYVRKANEVPTSANDNVYVNRNAKEYLTTLYDLRNTTPQINPKGLGQLLDVSV